MLTKLYILLGEQNKKMKFQIVITEETKQIKATKGGYFRKGSQQRHL